MDDNASAWGYVLVVVLFIFLVVVIVEGLQDERVSQNNLRLCLSAGYADVINYSAINTKFCIGMIDGEWKVKPLQDLKEQPDAKR